jgi:hypothetical protein
MDIFKTGEVQARTGHCEGRRAGIGHRPGSSGGSHDFNGGHLSMAVFTVLNGAGLNGAGIQFGALSQVASSGVAAADLPTPTGGAILFLDGGELGITGAGLSFTPPATRAPSAMLVPVIEKTWTDSGVL